MDVELERRLETLEASAEAAQVVLSLLMRSLTSEQQAALRQDLEPLRRRVRAEAPRAGEDWRSPGARALNRALDWIEAGLSGEDLSEV